MSQLEVISYSELDTYRQCRLKHQLAYRERWRPEGEEAEALARGTLFHSVMEAHYDKIRQFPVTREYGPDAAGLYTAVGPLLYDRETGAQSERQELVEWIYKGYVDYYGLDEDWEIVAIEQPLEHPLGGGIVLKGTVDLIVRQRSIGKGLWIVDHKTCKDLPKQKDFDMEDQTGIYAYLMRQNGMDIRGAIYNHCRTYKLKTREMDYDERFKRTLTVRGDRELETMAREAMETMQEAYSRPLTNKDCPSCHGTGFSQEIDVRGLSDAEVDRLLREYDESPTPCSECGGTGGTPRDAPRTPDGERCGWKCGFTEACLAGRKLGPQRTRTFLSDIGFTQHDTKPGPTFNKER